MSQWIKICNQFYLLWHRYPAHRTNMTVTCDATLSFTGKGASYWTFLRRCNSASQKKKQFILRNFFSFLFFFFLNPKFDNRIWKVFTKNRTNFAGSYNKGSFNEKKISTFLFNKWQLKVTLSFSLSSLYIQRVSSQFLAMKRLLILSFICCCYCACACARARACVCVCVSLLGIEKSDCNKLISVNPERKRISANFGAKNLFRQTSELRIYFGKLRS